MNIVKRLVRICALYSKKRRLKKMFQSYNVTKAGNELSKTIVSDGADLTFNSKSKDLALQVLENVTTIVRQTNGDSSKLLGYIEASGTKVFRIINAQKMLKNIGEEEGFIPPKDGIDALYLSLITLSGIKIHTPPMIILSRDKLNKYLILYSFYKWYSMKSGLGGFEYSIQKKYNKFLKNTSKVNVKGLTLEDITGLQEAIARDREATDFVLKYEKETDISKKISNKISQDGGANI